MFKEPNKFPLSYSYSHEEKKKLFVHLTKFLGTTSRDKIWSLNQRLWLSHMLNIWQTNQAISMGGKKKNLKNISFCKLTHLPFRFKLYLLDMLPYSYNKNSFLLHTPVPWKTAFTKSVSGFLVSGGSLYWAAPREKEQQRHTVSWFLCCWTQVRKLLSNFSLHTFLLHKKLFIVL